MTKTHMFWETFSRRRLTPQSLARWTDAPNKAALTVQEPAIVHVTIAITEVNGDHDGMKCSCPPRPMAHWWRPQMRQDEVVARRTCRRSTGNTSGSYKSNKSPERPRAADLNGGEAACDRTQPSTAGSPWRPKFAMPGQKYDS